MNLQKILDKQKLFFNKNTTKSIEFRKETLKNLKKAIENNEENLFNALYKDLGKCKEESYLSEISMVKEEIDYFLKNIDKLSKPKKVKSTIKTMPSKNRIYSEPLGTVLVLSSWNYPFQLSFLPIVGALSAGNTVMLKMSEYSVYTNKVMEDIIKQTFEDAYVYCIDNKNIDYDEMLSLKYDYIFFTGSKNIAKHIAKKASENLVPTTLELGGKSPCIVEKTANIDVAARRIVWGKFLNAGQTCIAPDYILADQEIKDDLIKSLTFYIKEMYTENVFNNKNYPKIITERHFDRLLTFINGDVIGGRYDKETLKIEPTIIDNCTFDHKSMEDEIFGPIIPIIVFKDLSDIIGQLKNMPKPLAFYLFTKDKSVEEEVISNLSFGGGCINDVLLHILNNKLPFGGVGESGLGSYHGEESFNIFSNKKPVVKKLSNKDVSFKYHPYNNSKKFASIKKLDFFR
ncbi:MAG: aldehyde dehydrogenase family protein [Oscillospiraceae bacterium]